MTYLKRSVAVFFLVIAVYVLSGCQGPASSDAGSGDLVRRAQVVGHENIQLKKVIADKDREIADLNRQLEAAQAENERILKQNSEIHDGLLRQLLECTTKLLKYEPQQ